MYCDPLTETRFVLSSFFIYLNPSIEIECKRTVKEDSPNQLEIKQISRFCNVFVSTPKYTGLYTV